MTRMLYIDITPSGRSLARLGGWHMARSLSLHLHIIFVESHNKSFSSYNVLILRCLVGRKQRIKKNLFWVYIYIFIVHFYGAIGVLVQHPAVNSSTELQMIGPEDYRCRCLQHFSVKNPEGRGVATKPTKYSPLFSKSLLQLEKRNRLVISGFSGALLLPHWPRQPLSCWFQATEYSLNHS